MFLDSNSQLIRQFRIYCYERLNAYSIAIFYPSYIKVFLESLVDHVQRGYCWAFGTSSMKIRDIVAQPV